MRQIETGVKFLVFTLILTTKLILITSDLFYIVQLFKNMSETANTLLCIIDAVFKGIKVRMYPFIFQSSPKF